VALAAPCYQGRSEGEGCNITSTNLDDFRDGKGEVVLWPDQYKAGEPILPYSAIKH